MYKNFRSWRSISRNFTSNSTLIEKEAQDFTGMNLLLLTIFATVCAVVVQSRYPYDDTYTTGDIVPSGVDSRYPYDRDVRYPRKHRSGYGGYLNRRGGGYGRRYEDDLYGRDYRRRHRDYDSYLPPRGLGGYQNKPYYGRPDYEYGRRRTQIAGPPKYFDEDEFVNAGYNRRAGLDIRLTP